MLPPPKGEGIESNLSNTKERADPVPMNDEEREQWEKWNEGEPASLKHLKKELEF
ncbi:hypothetical protein JIR001_06020 [Polycladomyces abyssicola]|uniref:Uncharacterized protein n=1 Tax=Polycladomyces abyssicola TaxID=1125966 RepID=A0A8D5ZJT6_9BACL|nr:hypothetical protein JIR001_06020 [Polycladomyces abyssicola]